MDSQGRSDIHLTRIPRPRTDLVALGHRSKSKSLDSTIKSGPRRKRSTESVLLAEENPKRDQENKHYRTSSVDTIRIRPAKSSVHVVAARQITSASLSTTITSSAGATKLKQKPKSVSKSASKFQPFRLQSTNQETESPTESRKPRGPRKGRTARNSKKDNNESFPRLSTPASLNVDGPELAFETSGASEFAFSSLNELDDLARWDMDSLPSIPTPPDTPEGTDNTNSSPNYSNPFSSNLNDDSWLTNDIPLPSNRSRVVLENMGIKKSKTAAASKGRSVGVGASILNRHVSLPRLEPPAPAATTTTPPSTCSSTCRQPHNHQHSVPGLPPPLPLRTLCQNAGAPHPLDTPAPLAISGRSPLLSKPLSMASSGNPSDSGYGSSTLSKETSTNGSSKTKRDAFGCVHLGADDCKLSLMFPQTSHYEVWDMADDVYFAVPLLLCLMAKDALAWTGLPLALPDVSLIDLRCDDVPLPSPIRSRNTWKFPDQGAAYSTTFLGGKSAREESSFGLGTGMNMMRNLKQFEEEQTIGPNKISIDGRWARTYAPPGVEGRPGRQAAPSTMSSAPSESTSTSGRSSSAYTSRGWFLKFWVPIPTRLFAKYESRSFRIQARVWMMGDEERVPALDRFETGPGPEEKVDESRPHPLLAETEMTASHLRREREMDRWW